MPTEWNRINSCSSQQQLPVGQLVEVGQGYSVWLKRDKKKKVENSVMDCPGVQGQLMTGGSVNM